MFLAYKALEYHQKAYDLRVKYDNKKAQATSLNNIGICLKELNQLDKAEVTYKKGLVVAKASDNLRDYYSILDNLGNVYQLQNKNKQAISPYLKALDVPESLETNQKTELAIYTNLIRVYNKINKPKKALVYSEKGFDILKRFPDYENDNEEIFLSSAESYYMIDNFVKAREMTEKYITIKDSMFSEQNAKAIADLEIKYDTEKKEKQILIQRAELAEQDLVIQKRNYQVFGLAGLILVLGLIGFLFYNQQKLRNAQLQKENQLKDALLKIETQNKLQEQRLRISRDLHDNIGAQLTFIISSIDNLKYGFDIKDDKLTTKLDTISEFTSGTIYELRDTIWAMNKNEITFEDLQARVSNLIDKANLSAQNIVFNFRVNEDIDTAKSFTSVEGMNIYRIIQEAINNALKYAEASEIKVRFFQNDTKMNIAIMDNGKGFDIEKIKPGNGLENMKKRADEINGNLVVETKKEEGTTIYLNL